MLIGVVLFRIYIAMSTTPSPGPLPPNPHLHPPTHPPTHPPIHPSTPNNKTHSPVTRASAGAQYHLELARQLTDFLLTPLPQPPSSMQPPTSGAAAGSGGGGSGAGGHCLLSLAGGMMSLADAFCAVNRARGTALLSPEDLLAAARLLPLAEPLATPAATAPAAPSACVPQLAEAGPPAPSPAHSAHSGLRLCRFRSGVLALSLDSHDGAGAARRLSELAAREFPWPPMAVGSSTAGGRGITVADAAALLAVSFALALEALTVSPNPAGLRCTASV